MLQNNIWTKDVIGFKASHTNNTYDECRTALETGRKARETYLRTRKEHQKQYEQKKEITRKYAETKNV